VERTFRERQAQVKTPATPLRTIAAGVPAIVA